MLDFDGIELSEEAQAKLLAQVQGLKDSKESILAEKKASDERAKEYEASKVQLEEMAKEAELAKLEAQGKYEEANKMREEEKIKLLAESEDKYNTLKAQIEDREVDATIAKMLNAFTDEAQPLAEAYLRGKVEKGYNDGNLSIMLDGKTPEDFISGATEDNVLSSFLKGADTSGAGTNRSTQNQSSSGKAEGTDAIRQGLANRLKQKGI